MYLYAGTLDNIFYITFQENINFEDGHFEVLIISGKKIETWAPICTTLIAHGIDRKIKPLHTRTRKVDNFLRRYF